MGSKGQLWARGIIFLIEVHPTYRLHQLFTPGISVEGNQLLTWPFDWYRAPL